MKPYPSDVSGEAAQLVLHRVSYEELPSWAVERFELYSWKYISHGDYQEKNFSEIWKLDFEGSVVFVARQEKNGFSMAYLYGERDGVTEFWGEIGDSTEECWDSSYLYFIGVAETFRRSGVASRNLFLFDAVSRFAFKKPLRSGTLFTSAYDEKTGKSAYPVKRAFERLSDGGYSKFVDDRAGFVFQKRVWEIVEKTG